MVPLGTQPYSEFRISAFYFLTLASTVRFENPKPNPNNHNS